MRLPFIGLTIAIGIVFVGVGPETTQASAQPASMSPLGTPLPAADEKIQEVADAKARFAKLDFTGTLDLLREAVKKHPDRLPPAQLIMGLWYSQINQGAAVLGALERAVAEVPDDPEAYVFLGDVEFQGGRVTAAGLLFGKANELSKSFTRSPDRKKNFEPRIYGGLAAVAEARATMASDDKGRAIKEWVAAQGYLEAWLKLDPKNAIAMQRLARALFKQKTKEKVNAAYEKLKEAQKADPDVLTPAATMAKFYQGENDFKNAKKFMDYALQVAPDDLRTQLDAAQWCLQTSLEDPGQLDKAREHATKATKIDEKSLNAMILRGVVYLYQKEYGQAASFFRAASLDAPSNFAASNNLALALCEQDETKKRQALQYAEQNARLFPKSAEAASTYGWVLYKAGQVAQADNVLNRLVRSARVSEDTLYYAARVATDSRLGDRRRPTEAVNLLKRAVDGKRPFTMRPEAEALLEQLRKTSNR